eukprot:Pgem_evm1s12622
MVFLIKIMYVTPEKASKYYAVSVETLRKWTRENKLNYKLTPGNHARYWIDNNHEESCSSTDSNNTEKSNCLLSNNRQDVVKRIDALYCRVSSKKQEKDLERQKSYLLEKYPKGKACAEIGSALTLHRAKLQSLLGRIIMGEISRVIVSHKDRITRFGFEWFEFLCKKHGTTIVVESKLSNDFANLPEMNLLRTYWQSRTVLAPNFTETENLLPKISKLKTFTPTLQFKLYLRDLGDKQWQEIRQKMLNTEFITNEKEKLLIKKLQYSYRTREKAFFNLKSINKSQIRKHTVIYDLKYRSRKNNYYSCFNGREVDILVKKYYLPVKNYNNELIIVYDRKLQKHKLIKSKDINIKTKHRQNNHIISLDPGSRTFHTIVQIDTGSILVMFMKS